MTRRPSSDPHGLNAANLVERVRGQGERVHIPLGAVCNNNCLFCMEEDRLARKRISSAVTHEHVRWVLTKHQGAEEICFTSGEPTTHPELTRFVGWAKTYGFTCISVMTNGRRLSYEPYTRALIAAGLNRVYVSIHGHTAALHEGLTRTPGSFDQTVAGIRAARRLAPDTFQCHTSTVLTQRNVNVQLEIYELLRGLGVDQVVFNALHIDGRAFTHFDRVVPTYQLVRQGFERLLKEASDGGERAFLVDVPPCITHGLPEHNRGFLEMHTHYEAREHLSVGEVVAPDDTSQGPALRAVHTSDLDERLRMFRSECDRCRYRSVCQGVYGTYIERFGWSEFAPVEPVYR